MFKTISFLCFLVLIMTSSAQAQQHFDDEVIEYKIKKMGVKVGEASLTYKGETQLNGKDAVLIVFKADALNFLDEEYIYADPVTMFPIEVHRNLNLWGKKEQIVESYDHVEGRVVIAKTVKGEKEEIVLNKQGPIDNLYCFIFRHRTKGVFEKDKVLSLNLPTQDVVIKFVGEEDLKIAGTTYPTYFIQSDPKKYNIWFGTDYERIPLRIDGAVGMGKTSLEMTSYQSRFR